MSSGRLKPSSDFTDKVMTGVKKRPRKIGAWNLLYFAPILLAIFLLAIPSTQEMILNMTSKKHVAVAKVQDDVDGMYLIMNEIDQFNFDQDTQDIINNDQPVEQ